MTSETANNPPLRLQRFIEDHIVAFRDGEGESLASEELRIRRLAIGRNVVYRLHDDRPWYLKVVRDGAVHLPVNECLGFENLSRLDTTPFEFPLRPPEIARASSELGYIMTTELGGDHLVSTLYRSCLMPVSAARKRVFRAFHDLGTQLAKLHRDLCDESLPVIRRHSPHEEFADAVSALKTTDPFTLRLVKELGDEEEFENDSFIHANLRRENILLDDSSLGLIDFEDCGYGSRYHDLSRVLANLLLTRTALLFPWRRVQTAAKWFLKGYFSERPSDMNELRRAVLLRVATNHTHLVGGHHATIFGVPVSKRKHARLVMAIREGDLVGQLLPPIAH